MDTKLVQLSVKAPKTSVGKVVGIVATRAEEFDVTYAQSHGRVLCTFPVADDKLKEIRTSLEQSGLQFRVEVFK
jgi:hypothetical protein